MADADRLIAAPAGADVADRGLELEAAERLTWIDPETLAGEPVF
jgi:hypothetical protein